MSPLIVPKANALVFSSARNSWMNADALPVRLPLGVGGAVDVAPAAVHGPGLADLAHGLPDQRLLERHQGACRDRRLLFLRRQHASYGRYRPQVVGLAQEFASASADRVGGVLLHVVEAEFPDAPVQVAEGVGGDLHVGADADEGQLAVCRVMDDLAVEGAADAGNQVPQPLRQGLGGGGLDAVGFIRLRGCFDVRHGQVVLGQQPLGVGGRQCGLVLVAGVGERQQFSDFFDDRVLVHPPVLRC